MVSSYRMRRQGYQSSDMISTRLTSSLVKGEFYTTRFFGRNLSVTVTSKACLVGSWISKSLFLHRRRLRYHHKRNIIVGLGTQWFPFQFSQCPATIQMCIGHRVLIYQILGSRSRSHTALSRLLRDQRITFVGYNIENDCRLLKSYHGLEVNSTVELRAVSGMGNASMESMAERFLGLPGVAKPRSIGTSDWDARSLSIDQIQYAALDAHVSFLLGVELAASPSTTVRASCNLAVCDMGFANGGSMGRFYDDPRFDREGGSDSRSDREYYEKDELDSYSGGESGSMEFGW